MTYTDGSSMSYGWLVFPLLKDKVMIDSTGQFQVDISDAKHRVFYLSNGDVNGKIFRVDSTWDLGKTYQTIIPDIPFYAHFRKSHVCPICLKSKNIIPVVYGLPGKSLLKKAEKGLVMLMGCIVPQNQDEYYCKTDDFYF